MASPAALPAAVSFFLHSSIGIRTGVPDPVPYSRYLQNGISSFFILQNYSNRGLNPKDQCVTKGANKYSYSYSSSHPTTYGTVL